MQGPCLRRPGFDIQLARLPSMQGPCLRRPGSASAVVHARIVYAARQSKWQCRQARAYRQPGMHHSQTDCACERRAPQAFGSRACGLELWNSDIDIAILGVLEPAAAHGGESWHFRSWQGFCCRVQVTCSLRG